MADDVQDGEITLDDFNADEQVADKTEPSPVKEAKADKAPAKEAEAEKPEAKGKESEVKADDTATPPDVPTKDEGKEEQSDDAEETEDKPEGEEKPLKPKSENRFQKLANENRELRDQVEKLTSDTYAPQSVQQLTDIVNPETGQPYTVAEATDIALNQQLQMRDYNTRIVNAQTTLGAEAYEVLQRLPIFDSESEQYDGELAGLAATTMEANLIRDDNIPEIGPGGKPTGLGIIVDYKQSPKQIYETIARVSGISAVKGQIKAQQATEQQLVNVDAPSNSAPAKKPTDPLMELWKSDD